MAIVPGSPEDELARSTRIIETTIYTRQVGELLEEDEKQELLDRIIALPDSGKLIPGSGGLRKLRWSGQGRGKRGGTRIIYYWRRGELIYLLLAYPKNLKEDLSADEVKALRAVVESEIES